MPGGNHHLPGVSWLYAASWRPCAGFISGAMAGRRLAAEAHQRQPSPMSPTPASRHGWRNEICRWRCSLDGRHHHRGAYRQRSNHYASPLIFYRCESAPAYCRRVKRRHDGAHGEEIKMATLLSLDDDSRIAITPLWRASSSLLAPKSPMSEIAGRPPRSRHQGADASRNRYSAPRRAAGSVAVRHGTDAAIPSTSALYQAYGWRGFAFALAMENAFYGDAAIITPWLAIFAIQ